MHIFSRNLLLFRILRRSFEHSPRPSCHDFLSIGVLSCFRSTRRKTFRSPEYTQSRRHASVTHQTTCPRGTCNLIDFRAAALCYSSCFTLAFLVLIIRCMSLLLVKATLLNYLQDTLHMRLIDTHTGDFRLVADHLQVPYAILSHTWSPEGEQSYRDVLNIQVSFWKRNTLKTLIFGTRCHRFNEWYPER